MSNMPGRSIWEGEIMKPSNIDKTLNQVPRGKRLASSSEGMELELMEAINRAYDKAVEGGFKGSKEDWINTTPVEELKRIEIRNGGKVIDFAKYAKSRNPKVKRISLSDVFDLNRTLSSLSKSERETLDWVLNKTFYKKD